MQFGKSTDTETEINYWPLCFSSSSQAGKCSIQAAYHSKYAAAWLFVMGIPPLNLTISIENHLHDAVLFYLIGMTLLAGLVLHRTTRMLQRRQAKWAMAISDGDEQKSQNRQLQSAMQEMRLTAQLQTAQLQQALVFEDLLRRIIERVRDSLDETHILQTVVRELALALKVQGCDVALYNLEEQTSTICYEYLCTNLPPAQGCTIAMAAQPQLYDQLLQPNYVHFCLLQPGTVARNKITQFTYLACPMMDDQVVLGDLWLFRPKQEHFSHQEIRLVQQVANQCAIALRQSRLYQTAQTQVKELERLHRIKDDFLSTVSHELRTPMANIEMATQLLEMSLTDITLKSGSSLNSAPSDPVERYLQILRDEAQREMALINNLLDLSRLEAGTEPYICTTIDPKVWIPHVVEPFIERARLQQQQLDLDLAPDLPLLTTDLADLERILSELLNNACKYTPAGEQILVAAKPISADNLIALAALQPNSQPLIQQLSHQVQQEQQHVKPKLPVPVAILLSVSNSGTEIPEAERDRIFDKFYRIPSNDPWKYGGTGLGLALVKGLIERLGGRIYVESSSGRTTFVVQLPIKHEPA
jgi:signal transduction histidine kinase